MAKPPPTEADIRATFLGTPGLYGTADGRRADALNDAILRLEAEETAKQIIAVRKAKATNLPT